MKTIASLYHLIGNRLVLSLLIGLAACAVSTSASGQAMLSFAGGSGAPIQLALGKPVTFTITNTAANNSPLYFVFQGVGNIFGSRTDAIMGSISYQTFAGSFFPVNQAGSGLATGSIASTDFYLIGTVTNLSLGTVVTLGAGTDATFGNFFTAAPAGGTFNVFIANSSGTILSTNGVAVAPEPSTWALLGGGSAALGVVGLRRRASGKAA